ncbi:MAG: RnfABCDGE type electron transport complex subunit B [Sphaerochaetaceae bacterium]|nr:RnfABCDGE type electron transport complex subunit B [Sphaerochaetaceae bacterium]
MAIFFAFLIIAGLGALLGIGLAVADKKLAVEKDEKLVALEKIMPGANCGGCGFAGCADYASAVASGTAQPGLCSPGGKELAEKMGQIMGVEVTITEKQVAYIFCKGNCEKTKKDYDYKGLEDCNAASILFKGDNGCKYGCLHLGSCQKVCDSEAIYRQEDGTLAVNPEKCIGCGKCTKICPNGVIKLIPARLNYVVACNSHDKGGDTRKLCELGCIGCKICQTKFPEAGFVVENNLAVANADGNAEQAELAMAACPRKAIIKR